MSAAKLAPSQPPVDFSGFTPTAILEETEKIIGLSTAFQDQLVATISAPIATFSNVVRPLIDEYNRASCRLRTLGSLLVAVSPDPAVREASRQAQKLILGAEADRVMRGDVANLICAVHKRSRDVNGSSTNSESGLDPEDCYLLERLYNEYQQSGATITDVSQQSRLRTVQDELNDLRIAAQKAFISVDDGIWFSRFELSGIPEAVLEALKKVRSEDGNEINDKLWAPFHTTATLHILRDAEKSKTRQKYHVAYTQRFPDNVDRLQKIIVLRQEAAELMGFEDHASLKMEEKMADSVSDVESLLQEIRTRLEPIAKKEIERLLQFKKKDISRYDPSTLTEIDDPSILYAWDWIFYASQLRKEYYSIDAAELSEYFEAGHTFDWMLKIFEILFGMEFLPIETSVWHESVIVYAAWDSPEEGGGFLGYLYVDLYERDGKHGNGHHLAIQRAFVDADGTRHFPCSALVLGLPMPKSGKPTLLLMSQIRMMFHELGHSIHNLCSSTKYGIPHSRDFVEVPSLMLEHWIWNPDVLVTMGKHYTCLDIPHTKEHTANNTTGGRLPRDLALAVARTKSLHKAHEILAEVQRALYDLEIHSTRDVAAAKELNTTLMWNKMRRDIIGLNTGHDPDESIGFEQAAFGHIFRKYDAGFFAYPLSKVFAADLYNTVFANDPLSPSVARRYRYTVLKRGSSQSEMKTLEDFLGRKPDAESFFREAASAWPSDH